MDDESVVHLRAPWLPLLVTLSLMTILGALVGWQWQTLETSNQNEHEQRFSLAVDDIEQSINERMRAYEMVLRGLSGLMVGRDDVSVDDWQRAADQLQLQDRYRGIQAVSWSRYLLAGQLEGFQAQEQGAGRKDFRILPPGERDQYLVVDYISPLDWRNRRALGFDMITEPIRAQAIVQARNTGEAVLTAPLRLRQETEKDVQAGAILYLPVYRAGAPVATVEERTAAMLGTVAGTFRLHDLLQGVLGSRGELLQVELVDTADNGGSLLNGGFSAVSRFQLTRTLSIYGRSWQLTVSSTPAYEQMLGNGRSTFSLWVGLLAAALLGLLVGGYLYLRERALANSQLLSERLREREERFRLVVEASPNAIVLVDSSGRIAMVNRQAELMFGYPRAELLGQSVEMLLPESLRAAHVGMRKGFQQAPEPRQMGGNRELFGQHRDGHSIPLEVGLSPLRSGEDVLVQAVIIDISERKAAEKRLREQAEQLALANRYKSEFLANMSHELRTPLNSILILSEQLKQNVVGNLSEKQVKHADIVHRAGSDLLQLINDVLDLAKIEAGRVQLKLEPLNVHDMLLELDASLRPMAELKGLRLLSTLEPGVPRVIYSDRGRLQQILRNLLSNALKFTERGEVELAISCETQGLEDGREMLQIQVRDTGIGIPAEQHQRVFQAFQQIDGSTSRRFGGTGLGLAITRQLVEVLEGDIRLESAPGEGSRFFVRLPVAVVQQSAAEQQQASSEPIRSGQGPALLVVEDDANFAELIAEEAQAHGFASVLCRNGKQAIALLQRERFAAVILDILLPDISGWQIYRSLRSQAQHRGTPVHIISCVPQPQDWADSDTRYLVKPIARADLEQVFTDLAQPGGTGQHRLLLVEDVEIEREHYREHLCQLGFAVTAVANAEHAREAYGQQAFSALVIDLDLPDQDGFDLLEVLQRQRPLNGTRVVVNTGVDVTQQSMQRLRRYSAVVVRKAGDDLGALSSAVQGFLSSVRDPQADGWIAEVNPLGGKRVLLVDDDVRNIYAMSALLDEIGFSVTAAKDGQEALACFAQEPFDLILMDMAMPNMDGYTATRLLKEEQGCTVPIIALTAHAMKGDREKCLAAGADDYLAKPLARQALLDLLYRWLTESEGRDGASAA